MLRAAVTDDISAIRAIERAAGEIFRALGMDKVADDEPPAVAVLNQFIDEDRAWVIDEHDRAIAYLTADVVDGAAHIEQVSVHPDHAHRRLGAALIEHLANWSRQHGHPALTLTTYREVAWNGPYYRRLGFRWLSPSEVGPGLRALRAIEVAAGLDQWPRGCMRRDLDAPKPVQRSAIGGDNVLTLHHHMKEGFE
jgi:GNAT superfamily N-acetyltransferase